MENKLTQILQIPKRKLVVSLNDIKLNKNNTIENIVFVLMVEESFGSAGGRGGGSGNRKIDKIIGFRINNNKEEEEETELKIFETENANIIEKFDIPYNAVAMDIILESGEPYVVQGISDQELINSYMKIIE
ncbi:MAG: hypothetical protein M3Z01_01285 [Thermoproteota archaeon]|nr:hypothetical protein [Thermoproteota archaeon]